MNSASRQLPSCNISFVRSDAAFLRSSAKDAPFVMVKVFHVSCFTSLRFLTSASSSFGGTDATSPALTAARKPFAMSSTLSALRTTMGVSPFSMASHFCCIACLKPMSEMVLSSFLKSASGMPAPDGTAAKACASGDPAVRYASASGLSFRALWSFAVEATSSDDSRDLMRPTTFLWSAPLADAKASDSTSPWETASRSAFSSAASSISSGESEQRGSEVKCARLKCRVHQIGDRGTKTLGGGFDSHEQMKVTHDQICSKTDCC